MQLTDYQNFTLVIDQLDPYLETMNRFSTQVYESPVGESEAVIREVSPNLLEKLVQLEEHQWAVDQVIAFGKLLGDFLLPDQLHILFLRSLDRLKPEQKLRIQLRLPPSLIDIPWEYLYLQQVGSDDVTGFLALNPRISIVRYEALPIAVEADLAPRMRRLVAAFANPTNSGFAPLNLEVEKHIIQTALQDVYGVEVVYVEQATIELLSGTLLPRADIFHFAGHGTFQPTNDGSAAGAIILANKAGEPEFISADQLAINLRSRGIQLSVLGACESGRREGHNIWNGVVVSLLKVGIPAVVAMQDAILDESAIAFTRSFYQALAVGLVLDEAVSAGRLAIFNLSQSRSSWRDWGIPVLYLRSNQNFVLPTRQEIASASLMAQVKISTNTITDDEQTYLAAELAQHRHNLLRLRKQKAIYAEGEEPLRLLNQIDAEEAAIQSLEKQLKS